MRHSLFLLLLLQIMACSTVFGQVERRIVHLSWKNAVDMSLTENLSLRSKTLEYDMQNLESLKSLTTFLPSVSYQGIAQHSLELPVFVFMGQRFVVGTPYTFQHSLSATLPLFAGGSRWFNHSIQSSLKKSLAEELKGKEEETVLLSLEAYYGILLSQQLASSAEEAVAVARQNLDQVLKLRNAGTATELDLARAKAQYSSTLPMLESALANRTLSAQRMKTLLNLPLTDSLVVTDTLGQIDFLREFSTLSLEEWKTLSREHRNDIKALEYQQEVAQTGMLLAAGQFTPTVALVGSVDHIAPLDNGRVRWSDYIRSKSLTLSVSWPLFEGGRRVIDIQAAKVKSDHMDLMVRQARQGLELDVEQNYHTFAEATKSLQGLRDALDQSGESLRISNLLYAQGMSSQLDVLNAQLLYTKSKTEFLQGIYRSTVSQLALLRSVGVLDRIWK